ncbi:hypothetical protein BSI_38390 [Bacillus inaquosorum KCTC 13429]|uniref:Uncharacterized protein n=1 Tax=Bacillus inaquosorum KCTC 13429 TaxID=1236548 RepID=A0A9W5LEW7_9BACI|nr:hypothetical protein BSI_38390 [Bacillus inaquosorum KCTC 13429]
MLEGEIQKEPFRSGRLFFCVKKFLRGTSCRKLNTHTI